MGRPNLSRETKFSGASGDKVIFPWSADHVNRIGNLPVDLYSAVCDENTYTRIYIYIYIYTVVACTLNSRLLSGHLGVIAVGDFFPPSAVVRWVCNSRDSVGRTKVLLLQNVLGKI